MRQRLAIAQAMLGLPDLLILDEPTNGLDPPQIREMREVMIRYAAAGRTVIVSSHLLAEVEQSCTHLVVMDRGRLVQAGEVHEIVGSSDTLLVGLAADIPDPLVEKVAALSGVSSAVRTEGGLLVRLAPVAESAKPPVGAGARSPSSPAPPATWCPRWGPWNRSPPPWGLRGGRRPSTPAKRSRSCVGPLTNADLGPEPLPSLANGEDATGITALPEGSGDPLRSGSAAAARLLVELVRLEVPVASLGPHRRLEDAFLTLIGGSA